ncbi:MAG: NAD-dependent epimerase/dehydratase family protein [Polyangiaceae bacterium]
MRPPGPITRAFFRWHARRVHEPRVARVASALARCTGPAASLLDVGAGDGTMASALAELTGARVVEGVEVRVRAPSAIPISAYDASLPFADGAFEIVVLSDVLHHAKDPARVLAESLRVASRAVAIKDHFTFGRLSSAILQAMDRAGNAAAGVPSPGRYFTAASCRPHHLRVRARRRHRVAPPHPRLPFWLVTRDEHQFAASIVLDRPLAPLAPPPSLAQETHAFVRRRRSRLHREPPDRSPRRARPRHRVRQPLSCGKRDSPRWPPARRAPSPPSRPTPFRSRSPHRRDGRSRQRLLHPPNPEARHGLTNTRLDLEQGTIATYNVLEAMRRTAARTLVFSSSGTVYGETPRACAEGDLGALPISLYGASKLAGEAMISAFVECFGLTARLFRFGNVVGPRGTHGAALDFLRKLQGDPTHLEVLGDGRQEKPYLSVFDCADGMLFGLDHTPPTERLAVYNLAPPDTTTVARIAELCIAASPHPAAPIRFTGGDRGWPGDVPRSHMDATRLASLGFRVRMTSDEAVQAAVRALAEQVFGPPARPGTSEAPPSA